jgi:hypothetical protein
MPRRVTQPASLETRSDKARNVIVVHGRNSKARDALFGLLRDIDLRPLEWDQMVSEAGGSPYPSATLQRSKQLCPQWHRLDNIVNALRHRAKGGDTERLLGLLRSF